MPSRTLLCSDCGEDYDFSGQDQARFRLMGYPDPVRCPGCRSQARKRRKAKLKQRAQVRGEGNDGAR